MGYRKCYKIKKYKKWCKKDKKNDDKKPGGDNGGKDDDDDDDGGFVSVAKADASAIATGGSYNKAITDTVALTGDGFAAASSSAVAVSVG